MSASNPKQSETLLACPLSHYVSAGLRVNRTDPKILCLDCGLTLAATDWITLYERWNTRRAAVAGPQGVIELLSASLLHPESAEGYVRQAIEMLSDAAASPPAPASSDIINKERRRCAGIARAWLWGSLTDPGVLESVGKYAAQRCNGILRAILSGADASHLAGAEGRDSTAPAERTEVEREQWRQGMRDAAKEVCDACADEYRYGRARKIEGSTRWWHGEHADFQCEAGSIWHALEADTAAAPADNDAMEVCRLLSTLDWIVGYELVGENQTILDRAQELALKVMGMSDPPTTTKEDR